MWRKKTLLPNRKDVLCFHRMVGHNLKSDEASMESGFVCNIGDGNVDHRCQWRLQWKMISSSSNSNWEMWIPRNIPRSTVIATMVLESEKSKDSQRRVGVQEARDTHQISPYDKEKRGDNEVIGKQRESTIFKRLRINLQIHVFKNSYPCSPRHQKH